MDADSGKNCSYAHLAKGLKRMVTKEQWLCWELHDNWVAYFKIRSCRSLHRFCGRAQTYGNQSAVFDSLKPCYVMLTFKTRIHRLEWFAQVILNSVTPAPTFEDRSQEETEWQQRCAREAALKLAKNILKLKEKGETAFFSPSENICLPAPSILESEEREFVVDTRASMHMISKKDLNSAELETLTTSRSPTTVITANGELQTLEEATVYVKELDKFLTMKVLEDTPAVSSLGKLCDEHGYSYEWINGQKITSHKKRYSDTVQHRDLRSERGSWFINEFFLKFCPLQHPWHLQGSNLIILRLPQARLPHQPWHLQLCQATVRLDKHGGDLCGIDSYPAAVSSTHVDRRERRDLCSCGAPEGQLLTKPIKNAKPNENEDHDQERETCIIPTYRNGCKNSEKILWMTECLNAETHTPVLLMNLLWSLRLREVRIWGKHSIYTHFPKDRNCEICQRTKITRAPRRRRIGGAVPRAENFGALITANHKVLCEGLWISKQSSICSRGWGLGHPMDPVVSVQNKKLLRKHKGPYKSSWSQIGSLKSFTLTTHWIWQSLWRSFLESLHVYTTPIGD